MKLSDKYDVTYIVSVTGEPETKLKATLEGCDRDKLLARDENDIVRRMLETLEEAFIEAEEEDEDNDV